MVTEFEIRREMSALEDSFLSPMAKTRRLLRMARRVRKGALTLGHMSLIKLQEGDGEAAARFRHAARRLVELHEELRERAGSALHSRSFGPAIVRTPDAYPRLNQRVEVSV